MARRSNMRVRVEGVDDVLKALERADNEMQKELNDLVSEAAEIVFRQADADAPYLTGRARNSLKIEVGKNAKGVFYANVTIGGGDQFYITFYELGNSRQPARPFMRPALDKSKHKIRQHLINGITAALNRQGK